MKRSIVKNLRFMKGVQFIFWLKKEDFVRNVTIDDKWSCAFQMALKKFTSARSLCLYVQVQSRLNKLNQALRSLVLYKKILSVNVYKYSKP